MRFSALSILLIVLVAGSSARAAGAPPAGNAENGKRIYMVYGCYQCHGTTGAGAGDVGAKLAPNPLPFEGIQAELRKPLALMPAYSEAVVSDQEIADIHAYLMTIPAGPTAANIPLLNQ